MGAFEKFVSANKLFWESSGRKIDEAASEWHIGCVAQYKDGLTRYYDKYGIDIFDKENLNEIFFYRGINLLGSNYTQSRLYDDLKEIQQNSDDYVTNFLSYEKCLNNYYEKHGTDTEWLVKIFAERYDLERFNISPEDVLDDLHKIMKGKPMLPSLNEIKSKVTNIQGKSENKNNDFDVMSHKSFAEDENDFSVEQWSRSDLADYYGYQYDEDYSYEQFLDDM